MQRFWLTILLLASAPLLLAQPGPYSVTVTATRSNTFEPDQAVFGVQVTSGVSTGLDAIVTALSAAGITAASLSTVRTIELPSFKAPNQLALQWVFSLPVPLSKVKDTTALLTKLQQSIPSTNSDLSLAFTVQGTEVSQQLQQSQPCSTADLLADATAQAQKLTGAIRRSVGPILALSSGAETGVGAALAPARVVVSGSFVSGTFSSFLLGPVPQPITCSLTVKFQF